MKWSSRDIVEVIGIAALVISLVFVGYELRQNSAIARMEAANLAAGSMATVLLESAHDPVMAALLYRINVEGASASDFSTTELSQINTLYRSILYTWYQLYSSVEAGVLDESNLDSIGRGGMLDANIFFEIWQISKPQFDPEFAAFIETLPWNQE